MVKLPVKYIFVLGGVISGLGKGIAAASIGYLLKSAGLRVTILKLDPYLNVDPGTMNPYQHGEVFVLDDGSETDLDLGHYERFIDVDIWNFELDSISPAINIGSETTANLVPYDINGNYRVLLPDLGCFEMVNY